MKMTTISFTVLLLPEDIPRLIYKAPTWSTKIIFCQVELHADIVCTNKYFQIDKGIKSVFLTMSKIMGAPPSL